LADDGAYWRDFLEKLVGISPDEQPETFFEALPDRVVGTYVYATAPHDHGDDCPAPETRWSAEQFYGAGA
jgi:hypothetical protein